jgi:UDP-glucose 4-epimerase
MTVQSEAGIRPDQEETMHILVTGGAGFIGSHVVDRYLADGHDVVVVDDLSSGKRENLNPKATFHQLDIRDGSALKKVFADGIDYVNHHAAQIDVRKSIADPSFDASVNVLGTLNLLQLAVEHGAKGFVFVSSGGVIYGDAEQKGRLMTETAGKRPESAYGVTKLAAEYYLYMYHRVHGLPYVALRYGNVFGPRQDPHGEAGVVAIFGGLMLRGKTPTVFGDGEQTRDYVYVQDIAVANMKAIELLEQSDSSIPGSIDERAFNIGSGRGTSVNDLYKGIASVLGFDRDPAYAAPRAGELQHIALDASKAQQELGFSLAVSLEEGLRKTIESIKSSS